MRTADRILAIVLGLGLFCIALIAVVEIVYTALGNSGHLLVAYESVPTYLREHLWTDTIIIVGAIVVALVGLLLLVVELKRRRPDLRVLGNARDDVVAAMPNRSLARVVTNAATSVPGVSSAKASVRRNKITVAATTSLREPGDLQARATAAATSALADLELATMPKLDVGLTTTKESS